ncbi:BglG family transcription antiterminator [Enterococcus sp. 669A]|uniref:Ascorbate-specific PTS system EIIA component n=1 Tax=Candidatus Enterococcus moelleringii TaxID=2815325 RepID=A0ABS3LIR0_9ENTE|nr:BglG family transcription antiterminator [Enterococcus sp. 669A]MBO1308254.1 BglG family transcription antiterminator [Enterococcus sp. 669A]
MKELEIQIIQESVQQHQLELKEFVAKYEASEQSIVEALMQINQLLKTNFISEGGQVSISEVDRDRCYRYLKYNQIKMSAYYEVGCRRDLLFLHLIFSELDLNLQELADQLIVSKNTALADIKRLKLELEKKDIYVKYSRKKGYYLFGSEFNLRNELLLIIKKILRKPYGRYLLLDTGYIKENELLLLRNRLIHCQEQAHVTFTEESMEELPVLLSLLIRRAQHFKTSWQFPLDNYDLDNTKEYPIYTHIFRGFENLNETDLLHMVMQILSATFVQSNNEVFKSSEVNTAIDTFITFLKEDCVMQFTDTQELKNKLLLHLRPAIFRCLLNVNIRNPLTERIHEEYPILYDKISEGVSQIEQVVNCHFPDEEIAFIAMIVISSMQSTQHIEEQKTFTAMVLCRSGMSISKMLLETLKRLFPAIEFIGAYAINEVAKSSIKPDFLFTTVPIHSEITTFLIPSFLDKQAKEEIKQKVTLAINQDVKKKTKELYRFLDDLFPDRKKEDALERIERFYQKEQALLEVQEHFFQLKPEKFSFSQATTWEEVFKQAFDLLKARGSVTQEYINVVYDIFKEDYPFMMIAKDTYLPHAKPEFGVLQPDYQVVLLQDPVMLPNQEPMKMIITLAPSRENQHVEWLLRLNHILLASETLQQIKEISSSEQLYRFMENSFENNDYFKEVSKC